MARKIVDIGVEGNDGTGDSIRESFRKTNENFAELYSVFGLGGQIAFTDLADTPETLLGNENKVAIVNPSGSGLTFKSIIGAGGIVVQPNGDNIVINAASSNVYDDLSPELRYHLNASNQLIGNLRAPINDSEFADAVGQFNSVYGPPNYSINSFAVNKGYVDNKFVNVDGDTMTGPLEVPAGAFGNQVPRTSEVVTIGGTEANRTMTAPLFLSDHPGELSGLGKPNGADDLQAASKLYVDNSTYTSATNLYVSTRGDDDQQKSPLGKEGRSWAYAYRSINKACQKAEELMAAAVKETGPYRQLIAYGSGRGFSEVTAITGGASGTTRVYFTNDGGKRVDQGRLPQPDIVPGKLVVGRTSGAQGIIFLYYGEDGLTGSDYFDLQDVKGTFVEGENLEFGQPVTNLNITIKVESGIYEEDYPIKVPANVAIVGDELRRVIVRPADRPSRSPWVDVWFRRDTEFDGLQIAETEYGYHYLTDASDRASTPKNNRDIDVFLCNDSVIIRQITCQGHGGFMMVLDPEGQVLTKSPYVQQSGSFSQSLNKQAFRGGQYVDGFAGNNPVAINSKVSDTELLVTGSERAPVTPVSFVVDGDRFKVDAFTDDGNGYFGPRQLLLKNKDFIKAEVIGYINSELIPPFTFDRDICKRDIGLILDALAEDLAFGANYKSVVAGKSYFGRDIYATFLNQNTQTVAALTYLRDLVSELLVNNNIAQASAVANLNEIIDIISNGVGNADAFVIPTPATANVNVPIARTQLENNLEFLAAEYIAYITTEYPDYVFNEPEYAEELQNHLYAALYDLLYDGNTASRYAGLDYYDSADNALLVPGQTTQISAGLTYIASILGDVILGNTINEFSLKQNIIPQVVGSGATATEANKLISGINTIKNILVSGPLTPPAIVAQDFATYSSTLLIDSKDLLLGSKNSLATSVINYLDLKYTYNANTCARDTGYIIDAIAHDIYYGGNLKSVQAASSYFNGTASARNVITTQLENTVAAIEYINVLTNNVIQNQAPTARYQNEISQTVDGFVTDGNLAVTRVDSLFDEMLGIISNPTDYVDARELLVANKNFIKEEVSQFITYTYKTTVTATSSSNNQLTGSTAALRVNFPIEFSSTSAADGLVATGALSGTSVVDEGTYTGVSVQTLSGTGSGAIVTVAKTGSGTTYSNANIVITVTTPGVGYKIGDSLFVAGSEIGGIDGVNDMFFKVAAANQILIGGLVTDQKYYVKQIVDASHFTVSLLPGGDEVVLTDGVGTIYGKLSYNAAKCKRDVGFIIANVSADLLYGGAYNAIKVARSYYGALAKLVLDEQLVETLAALDIAKDIAIDVLNQVAPTTNYQALNGVLVVDRITQVFDANKDGTAAIPLLTNLMTIVNGVIADPNYNFAAVLPNAKEIEYPVYKLKLSNTTPLTNPLAINSGVGYVDVVESSGEGLGPWLVTLSIPNQTTPLLNKTRYTIAGNGNPKFNRKVEAVETTANTMTFKFDDGDPGTFVGSTTTITYVTGTELLSPGNTSMCSNDFTQINDLGYGLVAQNIGLIEAVSVFTYYCYTAYYANNGGQIRSVSGSNAHGEFGLVSAGSDPNEVPDAAKLSDNMIQVARSFKLSPFTNANKAGELAVYTYQHQYAPYNVSELEINHGAGVIGEIDILSLNGGSGYLPASGSLTYANVPLTGGTGFGATADITVTAGVVTNVGIRYGGLRYSVGDLLSADNANIGGAGAGFSISVKRVQGNGIARYEVSSVTDVSSAVPIEITGFSSKTSVTGGYEVVLNITDPGYIPRINAKYLLSGNSNALYNVQSTCTASTATTLTLLYANDPGTWGSGTSTIWGVGNIIKININSGGNNDTTANGLALDLEHDQKFVIRGNQNFKFYEVDDTNPVRPSTALTFVDDPNGANEDAIVYRVLAYGNKSPLDENLAVDESVLGFDTTYDYIKLLVNEDNAGVTDTQNPGKTLGATAGDLAIAVDIINEASVKDRLNSADMLFAWDGKIHKILSYEDVNPGTASAYGIVRFEDDLTVSLDGVAATGINSSVSSVTNLDLGDAPTIRAGLAKGEACNIVVRISTTRVTGHDFLDIGTGGYNSTNFPSKIYGAPRTPSQSNEVRERTRGRVFYVTSDQDGIFRVGRFFTVDQGTGRVTFAASIALSNLDGLGFKRGVTVSEFSNDEKFTDGANDAIPTENAIQGYIDRRLGLFRSNNQPLDDAELIGPGFIDRDGILPARQPLNMGGNRLLNLQDPANPQDAATKAYVIDRATFENLTNVDVTNRADLDFLMYNGTNWIDVNNDTSAITNSATTIGGGSDLTISRSGNVITYKLVGGQGAANPITNYHINNAAEIAQSKLAMQLSTTAASAPTGTAQAKQAASGLSSFNSSQFDVTDGFVTIKASSDAATGVTIDKIQYIDAGTVLGNLSTSAAAPTTLTPGSIVSAGDGIKNALFTSTGVMTVTAGTPNSYSVTPITTGGGANSIVKTDASGNIDVAGVYVSNSLVLDVASTTTKLLSPGNNTVVEFTGTGAAFKGTVSTASNLSVTGNINATGTTATISAQSKVTAPAVEGTTSVKTPTLTTGAEATAGTIIGNWSLVGTSKLQATYADLAEYYEGDKEYEPGTVLIFGGSKEVTLTNLYGDRRVAGVVSENAAYIMNAECQGIKVCLALQGRVPVKVVGIVKKGDMLVSSAKPGYAVVNNDPKAGTVIGKALANKDDPMEGIIEVAVGRL